MSYDCSVNQETRTVLKPSYITIHCNLSSIAGDVTVDELMSKLLNDHEVFTQQQFKDIQEEVCIYSIPVYTTIVHVEHGMYYITVE